MVSVDIEKYRFRGSSPSHIQSEARPRQPNRHRVQGRFIKGPLSLDQLIVAANLGGKCLSALLALLFVSSIKKTMSVQASPKVLREFGVNRHSFYRALYKLETAGLISARRRRGKSALVVLLEPLITGEVLDAK